MKWFDKLPLKALIVVVLLLAVLPFPMEPVPHLVEKSKMLLGGELSRPIDIFDLFQHSILIFLVIVKLYRLKHESSRKN